MMGRTRLFVLGIIGALLVGTVGAIAAPPSPGSPPAGVPVPFARILAATVQDIGQGIAALHRALPLIAPRLEPIEDILTALREAVRDREEIELKDVQVELMKLDLHLHRLLFDLEQGARELAEFRDSVKAFIDRFTARMDPRMAQQFREFAQELLGLVQERASGRREGADLVEVGRIVQELKVAVNRLDLLLLRALDGRPTGE
ncbi:MAG: hypothetical protein Kow0097_09210 [Candidatus Bipolaricaulota bacterium]|nr:hypothetical protein [Candidatus Bipolaricaulota bacterium]